MIFFLHLCQFPNISWVPECFSISDFTCTNNARVNYWFLCFSKGFSVGFSCYLSFRSRACTFAILWGRLFISSFSYLHFELQSLTSTFYLAMAGIYHWQHIERLDSLWLMGGEFGLCSKELSILVNAILWNGFCQTIGMECDLYDVVWFRDHK